MLRLAGIDCAALEQFLRAYHLQLELVPAGARIPGSFWGDSEAGLRGDVLYARPDTPLHSILHEAAHYICMTPDRRAQLDRDAGGDDAEESAVCYLQILMAQALGHGGRERAFADMDEWGYSFRLGSTRAWFEQDAEDARAWLARHGVTTADGALSGSLRA
jgi:hypothetical protein